jgi:hypothetical protein
MQRGRRGALPVDAVMLVEAAVFGRDQCIHHVRRDLLERHPLAIDRLEFVEPFAVGRHDQRWPIDAGFADVADAGRKRHEREHVQQEQRRQCGERQRDAASRRVTKATQRAVKVESGLRAAGGSQRLDAGQAPCAMFTKYR